MKEIIERYISIGDNVYACFDKGVSQLSAKERTEILEGSMERVVKISENRLHTFNDSSGFRSDYSLREVVFHLLIQNSKGEDYDCQGFKNEVECRYPNMFRITPERLTERVREGETYVFYPSGVHILSGKVLEQVCKQKKYKVTEFGIGGLVGQGGYLDLEDALLCCLYFNKDGELIETEDLRNDFFNMWE